jgi:hypothetical protein
MRFTALVALFFVAAPPLAAIADGPSGASPLTTLVCRDRDHPDVWATLVFNLARKRLIQSSGTGGTILFGDGALPVTVTAAAIHWQASQNTFRLNRATLELDVINRVFFCRIAKDPL